MGRLQTFEGLFLSTKTTEGGQVGRANGGAGWLHPTLIDDNWDQILSVSKQAQEVATRLVRTEGGSPNRAAIQSQQWEDAAVGLPSQGGRDVMERISLRQRHRQQLSTSSRDSRDRQGRRARKGSSNEAVPKIKFTSGCVP